MNQRNSNYNTQSLQPDPHGPLDFTDLFHALWHGKWFVAITTTLAILAGGYYAFVVVTPIYNSSAIVILEPRVEQIAAYQSVAGSITGDSPEVNSEIEILRARSLMHMVVQHLDLINDPEFNRSLTPPTKIVVLKSKIKHKLGWSSIPEPLNESDFAQRTRDAVVTQLLKKVHVENLRQSTVFRVTAHSKQATKSARIADTIVDLYIQNQVNQKIEASKQATSWLELRVRQLQTELEEAETKVSNFSASTALVSAENLQALKNQIKDLRERIRTAEQARIQTTATENNTDVVVANSDQFTHLSRAQNLSADDRILIDQQLGTLRSSEAALANQIAALGQDLIALQQMGREAHATRQLYEHFLSKLKESAAKQGIQKPDSRVLSPAVIPFKPTIPRKSLIVSMSTVFGAAVSLTLVFFHELTRTTFRSLSSLERYSKILAIGQFPHLPVRDESDFLDHLNLSPNNAFSVAIRGLRTSLMFGGPSGLPQVIADTSSRHDEATAPTAIALTQNLVALDKSVLLIDTNMTENDFEKFFGDEPTRGIISFLRQDHEIDQCIHHPDILGADVLFVNERSISSADLFTSDAFDVFIREMKERYDLIVINAPAIIVCSSARAVLKSADAVLFNVKWGVTTKSDLSAAMRMLALVNQNITGMVLVRTAA